MSKVRNVLVFPGGTEIGLEINNALRDLKEVVLFSAGADVSSHAEYVFARHSAVPSVHQPGWIDALNEVIRRDRIDFVFPAHDEVILATANERSRIEAHVIAPSPDLCRMCCSKRLTYERLAGAVPVPAVYRSAGEIPHYPVFAKPDRGQGSVHASRVDSRSQLDALNCSGIDFVVTEYLPGEEYTVDCFSDRERGLLFCSGRQRDRVRSGISVATHGVSSPEFREMAEAIQKRCGFFGPWFFQVKRGSGGVLVLLEVAPRIAGAMALHRVQGVNFAMLALLEAERADYQVSFSPYGLALDRALINRYTTTLDVRHLYVDLDDTLVCRGSVSLPLVRLLYQQLNRGSRLVLVTRHAHDVAATLRRHRLSELFDEVVHLKLKEPKSSAIHAREGAIYIDDSYKEREEVRANTGIPVFDVSMIEALQDYRA